MRPFCDILKLCIIPLSIAATHNPAPSGHSLLQLPTYSFIGHKPNATAFNDAPEWPSVGHEIPVDDDHPWNHTWIRFSSYGAFYGDIASDRICNALIDIVDQLSEKDQKVTIDDLPISLRSLDAIATLHFLEIDLETEDISYYDLQSVALKLNEMTAAHNARAIQYADIVREQWDSERYAALGMKLDIHL